MCARKATRVKLEAVKALTVKVLVTKAMGPRRCTGFVHSGITYRCIFHPTVSRDQAIGNENGKCVVCNPDLMTRMCSTPRLRGCLVYHLSQIRTVSDTAYKIAVTRVPREWRADIVRGVCGEEEADVENEGDQQVALLLGDAEMASEPSPHAVLAAANKETKKVTKAACQGSSNPKMRSVMNMRAKKTIQDNTKLQKRDRQPATSSDTDKMDTKKHRSMAVKGKHHRLQQSKPVATNASDLGTLKIRRVTEMSAAGKIVIKKDDFYDEIEKTEDMDLQTAMNIFFTQQSSLEEMKNWYVRAVDGFAIVHVPMDFPVKYLSEVVVFRRGGWKEKSSSFNWWHSHHDDWKIICTSVSKMQAESRHSWEQSCDQSWEYEIHKKKECLQNVHIRPKSSQHAKLFQKS